MVTVAMHRWRKADNGHWYASAGKFAHGLLGRSTRMGGLAGRRFRVLGVHLSRGKDSDPGRDYKRPLITGKNRADGFDGKPVGFAVRLEFREVVIESGVNNAVRQIGTAAEALEVLQ